MEGTATEGAWRAVARSGQQQQQHGGQHGDSSVHKRELQDSKKKKKKGRGRRRRTENSIGVGSKTSTAKRLKRCKAEHVGLAGAHTQRHTVGNIHSYKKQYPPCLCTRNRNIPAVAVLAAAWVLRPNARPAARRSARRVDMILLGCCVSGAGRVVLTGWLN
jgi:hypothetical protein